MISSSEIPSMYLLNARNELPWAAMITFLPSSNLGAISSSQKGKNTFYIITLIKMLDVISEIEWLFG